MEDIEAFAEALREKKKREREEAEKHKPEETQLDDLSEEDILLELENSREVENH